MSRFIDFVHVGFTGTQNGMTAEQVQQVHEFLVRLQVFEYPASIVGMYLFHHGDCLGADIEAAAIAKKLGYVVVAHPGRNDQGQSPKRAFYFQNDRILPCKPYATRNRDIVQISSEILAAPGQMYEKLRSGTWQTIRYAKKQAQAKRLTIVYPDGGIEKG